MPTDQKNTTQKPQDTQPGNLPSDQANPTMSFSPQADLPPIPPEFQNTTQNSTTPINPKSANISPPKKKFGTGKIIATILGIFLLVGGVGAGILLTQQRQLLEQRASGDACGPSPSECPGCDERCYGKSDGDVCTGGTGTCRLQQSGMGCSCDTGQLDPTSYIRACPADPDNDISSGVFRCGDCGVFCISRDSPYTCAQVSLSKCGSNVIGQCLEDPVVCYYCPDVFSFGAQCVSNLNNLPPGVSYDDNSCSITGNFCGLVQCDTAGSNPLLFVSKIDTNDCGENPPPSSSPSPSPSPTPGAPSCSAIDMYDSEWQEIGQAARSSLMPGDVVHFCVIGSATSGTFDMARFTINGVLQGETADVRPGNTDFCQTYTIPEGVTTFDVSAEIHHSTEGWL